MDFQEIAYTKEEGIATITLNRPRSLNALSTKMREEWLEALRRAKEDPEVKVVIVTGAGRAFCSGANPRDLLAGKEELVKTGKWDPPLGLEKLAQASIELDKPYIGAINGPCVGGGWEMVSLCDIRIASEKARFGTGFIRMGEVPASIGCYILPRLIGIPRALEWLWTGRIITAEEAYRIGYVTSVVPHEELMPRARELALRLAKGPVLAINEAKRLTYLCLHLTAEEAIKAHIEACQRLATTEDALEGPKAWIEKREPIFKGR